MSILCRLMLLISSTARSWTRRLGCITYSARYYEASLAAWYGPDALADKYPSVGSYVYCAVNPVKLMDVDGKKIIFAEGCSKQFIEAYKTVVKVLNDKKITKGLLEMIASEKTYYTLETSDLQSSFNSSDKTIYWNPNLKVLCDNGYVFTNVEILNHEGGHGAEYDKMWKKADSVFNKEWKKSRNQKDA